MCRKIKESSEYQRKSADLDHFIYLINATSYWKGLVLCYRDFGFSTTSKRRRKRKVYLDLEYHTTQIDYRS